MKVSIILAILALAILTTRQHELTLLEQESSPLQLGDANTSLHVEPDASSVVAQDEDQSLNLSFDHPSFASVDKALESGMTIFSYDLESTSMASNPVAKYIFQLVHWIELLPARWLQMLFILVNNVSVYLASMNSILEPSMLKVHVLLNKNSSTYPLARLLCLLFFGLYSSIIPLLLLVAKGLSLALERSVKTLLFYQGLNFLLWPFTFLPIYFAYHLLVKFLPRFLVNPLKSLGSRLASILYALIAAPFQLATRVWNVGKRTVLSFLHYIGSFFGKGKKNSQNGKKTK